METSQVSQAVTSPVHYAGFWLRLGALLVDLVASFIPSCFVAFIPIVIIKLVSATRGFDPAVLMLEVLPLLGVVATWLYFAGMESSPWQATLGKKGLGLYVTDIEGKRLSFGRATGRTFAKYLSTATAGVGYLLCGFTPKKQALHDFVVDCLVLRQPRQ